MKNGPASNIDVRKANRNRIYRLIHTRDGISRPEIAQRLSMSLPTVLLNMKALIEQGLVREAGSLESTGGRKAVAMSVVDDARLAVGLDITRDRVVAALVNLAGEVRVRIEAAVPFEAGTEYVERVGGIVDAMLDDAAVDPERLVGAGISIPGVLSADGSVLTRSHVLDVEDYAFAPLDKRLGLPCAHVNDANAAGIAEMWQVDPDWHFVYLSLSNSVGGALVWDGNPRLGDNRRSGEIGHMTIVPDGKRCYCGMKGCLDAYCNATVLSKLTRGDIGRFFVKLRGGDAKAAAAWDAYLDSLAIAANSLRMVLDYDIVVGGYVGAYIDAHLDELRARAAKRNTFNESGEYIKACKHKTEASAVGAALMQIENFIDSI
ncbi:MAG: ROK family transcriptional regulator [Planctomycetaceae bacterium]|nr:ROK family transcriptional regulator [Planctomycetaceae bacterium]